MVAAPRACRRRAASEAQTEKEGDSEEEEEERHDISGRVLRPLLHCWILPFLVAATDSGEPVDLQDALERFTWAVGGAGWASSAQRDKGGAARSFRFSFHAGSTLEGGRGLSRKRIWQKLTPSSFSSSNFVEAILKMAFECVPLTTMTKS